MFSNNHQISMRQVFRLFTYDLIGMSTLLLPGLLAGEVGVDGVFAILAGTAAALCYVRYLGGLGRTMKSGFLAYCEEKLPVFWEKLVFLWLLLQAAVVSGYTAFIFAHLIQKNLLRDESYWLILLVLACIAGYGIMGGIEGRARIYEVLFWFIMLPLFAMLLGAVKEIDTDYWTPVFMHSAGNVAKASYLVFIFWGTTFWMLFLMEHVKDADREKKVQRSVAKALLFAGLLLAVMYMLLLGNFGSAALAGMEYPAVTFMSTVQITGGFLKRADALMLGGWFFTLFALLNTNLYYGARALRKLIGHKGNKRYVAVLVFMAIMCAAYFYRNSNGGRLFLGYLWYIGTPLMIVVPGLIVWCTGRKRGGNPPGERLKGRKMGRLMIVLSCILSSMFLSGCRSVELEDRCFPMLAAVEEDPLDKNVAFSCLYQPLEKVSDEMTDLDHVGSFAMSAEDFYQAQHNYEKQLNKVVDYNHMKVLVLGECFLADSDQFNRMVELLEQESDFPRNTYVCVTDQAGTLLGVNESLSENLGTYLEQLFENDASVDADGLPTLGSLFDASKNRLETLFLPYLTVQEDKPVITGYYCMQRGVPKGVVSMECGQLGFLENGALKQYIAETGNGDYLRLTAFHTEYDLSAQGRVKVSVSCEGELLQGENVKQQAFQQEGFPKDISHAVTSYVQNLAEESLKNQKIDLSNSYKKLGGYNRAWYQAWKKQQESGTANAEIPYEDTIRLQYDVRVTMVDH